MGEQQQSFNTEKIWAAGGNNEIHIIHGQLYYVDKVEEGEEGGGGRGEMRGRREEVGDEGGGLTLFYKWPLTEERK